MNRNALIHLALVASAIMTMSCGKPVALPADSHEATNPVASADESNHMNNPFTLVYDGAITRNEPGKVSIHPVTYKLNGLEIAANVYTPSGYDPKKSYPAIAVAHPNGGVKEQVAGLYAQRLAERGYITIAADAAYQGASGGQPRNVDKPAHRIEDIHGMADYIAGSTARDWVFSASAAGADTRLPLRERTSDSRRSGP